MYRFMMFLPVLAACGDKDGSASDDTASGGAVDVFSEIITIETEYGDLQTDISACFSGSDTWSSQSVDSSKVATVEVEGEVEDFETGNNVEDATVDFFYGNSVNGSPDDSAISDSDGNISGAQVPTCQPISYQVSTDPDLGETKITIQAHEIYGHDEDGDGLIGGDFNSVSTNTYNLIPSLLGISIDPAAGIVAGTMFGCGDEDPIEGVQVIVRDENGDYPESQEIRYFREEFPNRDQLYTSADGLWVAVNLPPGRATVEAWAVVDGTLQIIGETQLDIFADSINISNIYTGYGDGIVYPDSCLAK